MAERERITEEVEWSVAAYTTKRLPADQDTNCPACGGHAVFLKFCQHDVIVSFGNVDPHLKVTCTACGFWWQREVHRA
jgi:DNA-directed RNA polymerase subunit M/transcription elongation factor TFIIS